MLISEFNFHLPDELIAQNPLVDRDGSRMLVVDRASRTFADRNFRDFPEQVTQGDVLVVNNTKVFPARLNGRLETGAAIEIFLVADLGENVWNALARPGRRLRPGKKIVFGPGISADVLEKQDSGSVRVRFDCDESVLDAVERIGAMPLPPYIDRAAMDEDRVRYQTVYASRRGAIAAPTAGLHFTPEVLGEVRSRGVEVVEITLHVGYGTFEPVRVDDLTGHTVMPEKFEISVDAAATLNYAVADGRRIVAVGTTTTRALETSAKRHGRFLAENSLADLTIRPGHKFTAVGAMLTNFHLPMSSLLVLVSAFGGHELIMDSYRHAVEARYRFYSYGDCMFIS